MISGVIPIDKPAGFTSFDVIAKLRGILKIRRLGHSGTLDPLATGVLPVFIGKATRAADIIPDNKKRYTAGFALGFSTDTQDITGKIIEKSEKRPNKEEVEAALSGFVGKQEQLPPMYSAIKINGRRLYDIARSGETVERKPREIEVFGARLADYNETERSGEIEIECSKGTYIRTIINDLGERLGAFGAMTSLRRTYTQGFELSGCYTLEEVELAAKNKEIEKLVLSVEGCFKAYPKIELDERTERRFKCGVVLDEKSLGFAAEDGIYRICGSEFLGLGEFKAGALRVYKSFWGSEND